MPHPISVTVDQLKLDEKANVRKTGRGADAAFVASIKSMGILTPLTVRPNGAGFMVTNGGKRLAAIQRLVEQNETIKGTPAAKYSVPIYVIEEGDREARNTSLAANIIVAPMHPVDQYEAFTQLVTEKKSAKEIALTYGKTERQVEQILALGALSPRIRDAWRKNEIDAEEAQAFTLAPDQKSQEQAFERYQKDAWGNAGSIRHSFKANANDAGKLIEFVGIEAYEKRGGKVRRDLFGIDHTVSDPKLAKQMARELLQKECDRLVAEGWAWAFLGEDVKNNWDFGRIEAKAAKPTAEGTKRLEEIVAVIGKDSDEDELTAEERALAAEHAAIESKVTARGFTPEQKVKAGCFVGVSRAGALEITYGRVKPAQRAAVAAAERRKEKPNAKSAGEKKPNLSISNNLIAALSQQLTAAASEAIASHTQVAVPALIAGFSSAGHGDVIVVDQEKHRRRASFAAAFQEASKKPLSAQAAMLAQIVGGLVNMNVSHIDHGPLRNPGILSVCEALGAPLYATLKKHFDAKEYFNSVNRHIALKQLQEMFGKGYQAAWEKEKKDKIAKIAVTKAKETGWLPPELRTSFYGGPGSKAAAPKKRAA